MTDYKPNPGERAVCLTMTGMAALLLGVALYTDWRDEVMA